MLRLLILTFINIRYCVFRPVLQGCSFVNGVCAHYIINFIDITPRFLPLFAEKFSFEYLRKSHKIPLFSNKLVTDYIRSLTLACTAA